MKVEQITVNGRSLALNANWTTNSMFMLTENLFPLPAPNIQTAELFTPRITVNRKPSIQFLNKLENIFPSANHSDNVLYRVPFAGKHFSSERNFCGNGHQYCSRQPENSTRHIKRPMKSVVLGTSAQERQTYSMHWTRLMLINCYSGLMERIHPYTN